MMAEPNRKLKAARVEKGLIQKDMAAMLGISLEAYKNKENRKTDFTESEINKILIYLSKKYEEIFLNLNTQ